MTRLLLADIPKGALGLDCFEFAIGGGFRGLRGVAPGFHRIELARGDQRVVLDLVAAGEPVLAFALGDPGFVPTAPSALTRAAAAGDLDAALLDVADLPAAQVQAWRALTSRLAAPGDAQAWRRIEPPPAWRALDAGAAASQVVALQGAWLAMTHDRDEAAADRLAALLESCAQAQRPAVAAHPAVFRDVLEALAAMLVLAPDLVAGWRAGFAPLLAVCAAEPRVADAARRLAAAWRTASGA